MKTSNAPYAFAFVAAQLLALPGLAMALFLYTVGKVAGASQTFTKTTSNQYLADNTAGDAWVLGRLYAASVQSTVPNVLASLTTGAGSSANASAIKGTAPLPPLTAAQLMPILQLLLDD